MNRDTIFIALTLSMILYCLISCSDSNEEPLNISSYVVIAEATTARGVAVPNFYEQRASSTSEQFTIKIDSVRQTEDVTVSYTLSGTAELGKHIEPVDLQGSVTIPAGSLTATVPYAIITSGFMLGQQFNFNIRLTGVSGGNVRINASYASFTNVMGISCSSTIPSGTYIELTENKEVIIEEIENNVFSISNLNFRYYIGPEYGEIPGEFADRCGTVILQGKKIDEKYGVAWIGQGTWDNEAQEISLTVSDETFNPEYRVIMKFRYVP